MYNIFVIVFLLRLYMLPHFTFGGCMSKIGYIFRCVATMDYKAMLQTVSLIHKKTNKNRVILFFDMISCGFKYGCGYKDYSLNEWYNLNKEQRKTFITRGINNAIVSRCNNPEYTHILADKNEFNKYFSELLGRKWINLNESDFTKFESFMSELETVIAKPTDEACGRGVEKLKKSDFPSLKSMYDHILNIGSPLVEEYIVQHDDISKIYPHSVNTLRIVSIYGRDNEPHILYAFIRIGNGGRVVDNINAGGMAAPIDIDTGIINNVAFDKDYNYYEKHPMTGVSLIGYKIPHFEKAIQLVLTAARQIPQVKYVGWDVAVTADGVTFVEGNQHPGHDILQMPPHVPNKIGMLPKYREYIDI